MTTVCEIVTLADGGRLHISQGADTAAVLLLGHGAGGGIDVTDLAWLAEDLPGRGLTVVRHEQPWRVRGGRVAWPPARLDAFRTRPWCRRAWWRCNARGVPAPAPRAR